MVKFRKWFTSFMIYIALFKKLQSTIGLSVVVFTKIRTYACKTNKLLNIYTLGRTGSDKHLIQEMGNELFQNLNHQVYHKV